MAHANCPADYSPVETEQACADAAAFLGVTNQVATDASEHDHCGALEGCFLHKASGQLSGAHVSFFVPRPPSPPSLPPPPSPPYDPPLPPEPPAPCAPPPPCVQVDEGTFCPLAEGCSAMRPAGALPQTSWNTRRGYLEFGEWFPWEDRPSHNVNEMYTTGCFREFRPMSNEPGYPPGQCLADDCARICAAHASDPDPDRQCGGFMQEYGKYFTYPTAKSCTFYKPGTNCSL